MLATVIKTLFRNNKKNYFFLFIGFTLASLCLTQVFIVTESNATALRRYIYEEGFSYASVSISADLSYYDYYFNNNNSFDGYTMPSEFNNVIMEEIGQSSLAEKLPLSSTNFRSGASVITNENDYLGGITINIIPDNIFQYIIPFASWENSSVPSEDYAVLLVASSDLVSSGSYYTPVYATILDQENITLAVYDNEKFYSDPVTFNFSHKIIYEPMDNNEIGKILNSYFYIFDMSGLIITENLFKQFLSSINATIDTIEYIQNFENSKTSINAHVIHDPSKLDYTLEEYQQISVLKEQIKNSLLDKILLLTKLQMWGGSASSVYESFYVEFRNEQLRLTFLAIPIVLLLCFSVYYENKIFNSMKTKLTEFFKTHGIAWNQFLISELVLLIIIASAGLVLGVSVAIPIALFGYSSIGFLTSISTTSIVITGNALLQTVIIYCSIIALFSIPLLINRTRSFASAQQIRERKLTSKTRQTIFLVISSVITLSLLAVNVFVPIDVYSNLFTTFSSIYFLIVVLTISSLVYTINLFLELFTHYLSKSLWKKNHNIFGFSLRNITINKDRFKQGLFIFTTGFLVTILFMSLSFGLIATKSDEARYFSGADARISVSSDADLSIISKVIPSTIQTSEILKIDFVYNQLYSRVLSFYIINTSTFSKVAYYPSGDIGLGLQKAMNYLEQTNSCLIGINRAEEIGLQTGQEYSLKIVEEDLTFTQQLKIEELVKSWPFFIFERIFQVSGIDINDRLEIIVGYSTGQYLITSFENLIVNRYLLLDFTNYKADLDTIKTLVQELDELDDLVTYQEEFQDYINDPMVRITVNFSLFSGVLALLVTLGSLLFFTQKMFIDQKEQIHLYLSIGAKAKQIKSLFFFEVLVLVIQGTIFGLLLGILSLNFLSKIVISPTFIGSFSPRISSMFLILSSTLIGGIILSLILPYISINWNIKKELKQYYYLEEKEIGN